MDTLAVTAVAGPALLIANTVTSYSVSLSRSVKLIVLLVVVLSSTSSAVPSDKVTLYVTSPHKVWLNMSPHDITSEVSLLSNTLITGWVGGPPVESHKMLLINTDQDKKKYYGYS